MLTRNLAIWAGFIVLGIALKLGVSTTAANYKLSQQESHSASGEQAPSSRLHLYKPGDAWTYNLTARIQTSNGQTITGTGVDEDSIASADVNGQNVLAENNAMSFDLGGGHTTRLSSTTYFVQDAAGDYQQIGDDSGPNHAIRLLDQPRTIWPGDWSDNPSLDTVLAYRGGSQGHMRLNALGTGGMETAATGQRVMCWTVQREDTETDGTKTTSQMLFSPQLGQPLQQDTTVPQAGGSSIEFRGTLVSAP